MALGKLSQGVKRCTGYGTMLATDCISSSIDDMASVFACDSIRYRNQFNQAGDESIDERSTTRLTVMVPMVTVKDI